MCHSAKECTDLTDRRVWLYKYGAHVQFGIPWLTPDSRRQGVSPGCASPHFSPTEVGARLLWPPPKGIMRTPRLDARTRLSIEILEDRTVPTTATFTANGTLTVQGTDGDDVIRVSQSAGQIGVSGVGQSFSGVQTLVVDGGNGDDQIVLDPTVTATAWLYAGDGNDSIHGGGGLNHIFGGSGHDTLVAGTAADEVYGGTGVSDLSGPPGACWFTATALVSTALNPVAQQLLDLVNQQRAANGLPALTFSGQLAAAATEQVNNMTSLEPVFGDYNQALQHTLIGAPQPTMQDRALSVGYDYLAFGENIAYGYNDAASVMTAWMNSPGHRANILNSSYTQIGMALAYTADGVPYFAQDFGRPSGLSGGSGPTSLQAPTAAPQSGAVANPNLAGRFFAVGGSSTVSVYDAASGAVMFSTQPYGANYQGGLRVATGTLSGNGREEVVVAPGPGTAPLIRVYDAGTGLEVREFLAYDAGFTGGVNVALGDVNGDGHLDIVTGADAGGGPHVKVFDGVTGQVIRSFMAYDVGFRGGVHVAVADVNGDGHADVITGPGAGGGPQVEVFDGVTGQVLRSFFAYDPAFTGGVFVAAGELNGAAGDRHHHRGRGWRRPARQGLSEQRSCAPRQLFRRGSECHQRNSGECCHRK